MKDLQKMFPEFKKDPDSFSFTASPFSMRALRGLKEKVAEGRMRGGRCHGIATFPPHPLPHGEGTKNLFSGDAGT
ncbi:MAG: hypothetical protein ACOYL3_09320 [Desulfuromonadaceae bacterium]